MIIEVLEALSAVFTEEFEVGIYIFLFLFAIISLIVTIIRKARKNGYTDNHIGVHRQVRQIDPELEKRIKIREFWQKALVYSKNYIIEDDIPTLKEFLMNIYSTRDLEESAEDIHILLDTVVIELYPKRELFADDIIDIAFLDFSNLENVLKHYPKASGQTVPVVRGINKLVILLEKAGRIDDAINVCEYCASKGLPDYGYESFDARKAHLLTKGANRAQAKKEK